MKRHQARKILEACRPGGQDAGDPRVAEALALAAADAVLGRWWKSQRNFDARMSLGLEAVPVPASLPERILAGRKATPVSFWRRPVAQWNREWRVLAIAAAVVVLASVGAAVYLARPAPSFAEFRQQLIAEHWGGQPHLDFESTNLMSIRGWLGDRQAASDFNLPPPLQPLEIHGCRVLEHEGQRVSMLCIADGPRHLHLFVMNNSRFRELPPETTPDAERCGPWQTMAWRQGDRTYVLTGLKMQTFVNRFRKSGRWMTAG